jgi:hypothetical protein
MVLMHTTKNNVQIHVEHGTKSKYDFRVQFLEPSRSRKRTPTHVHQIVELYVKKAYNPHLTNQLVKYLLQVFQQVMPISYYPPKFQVFKPDHATSYVSLDAVGEFSVQFLLAVSELIFIQEKTNYPQGSLTQQLYQNFLTKDRFSVIQQAVFRGLK